MAHTFDTVKLTNAANGKTECGGGMNIPELMEALIAVNKSLGLPDIDPPVTSLLGKQMRPRLKDLLKMLPQDLDGTSTVAIQLASIAVKHFAFFGVENLRHSDQIWLADNATQAMMIHSDITLKPLANCLLGWSTTLEEIESVLDPIEFSIEVGVHWGLSIGVTGAERDKLDSAVGDLHVSNFARFYISYAPTGRATCYITGEKIRKGALRISFATIAGTFVIVKHGLAEAMLASLNVNGA